MKIPGFCSVDSLISSQLEVQAKSASGNYFILLFQWLQVNETFTGVNGRIKS